MPGRDRGETWRRQRLLAAGYDRAVHCEPLARAGARMLWGYDIAQAWAMIDEVGAVADAALVLDAPSGGGIALRGLHPGQRVRYVAADISAPMLVRCRIRARRRGASVGPVQADLTALPFPSAVFGLCLSYNGLHCLQRPAAAIAEYARVLRPGGILRGTAIVAGAGMHRDAVIWALQRAGAFGPALHAEELEAWLSAAAFDEVRVWRSGAVASFSARRRNLVDVNN